MDTPFCIVGAGPAGLTIGRLLQAAGEQYQIFEAGAHAGAFYSKFPIHRQLISINKRFTGRADPEFNLRHDWNSILTSFAANGTDFPFTSFSSEYFPPADAMVEYLGAFAASFGLATQYNTRVERVQETASGGYSIELQTSAGRSPHQWQCGALIWTAGLSQPRTLPGSNPAITPYHELPFDKSAFRNKTVLIIGAGQSAFETAKHIYGETAYTMLAYRTPPRFAWATHYVGDLRAINNEFLDAYQLKSLDAVIEDPDIGDHAGIERDPSSGKIILRQREGGELYGTDRLNGGWDMVVTAIGWSFDRTPFARAVAMSANFGGDKYPDLDGAYESRSHAGLYVAGTASHGVDKVRHSAGGFIHGFRYTARAMVRAMLLRRSGRPWTEVLVGCARPDVASQVRPERRALTGSEPACQGSCSPHPHTAAVRLRFRSVH